MRGFARRHPVWTAVLLVLAAVLLWMIFAVWPKWLIGLIGKKKVFLNAFFNGITLGGLYFLVASGFTLIFGLMRNVNLAHGSLYMLGGYIGYHVANVTGFWLLAFPVAFIIVGILGMLLQLFVFRRMEGEDLRQTLVTIGISIVLADLMLWSFGGDFYNIQAPDWLNGPLRTFFVTAVKSSGDPVYMKYPMVRVVIFLASVVVGVGICVFLKVVGLPLDPDEKGIDKATAFRNLNDMTDAGLLRRTELGDHVWRFELRRQDGAGGHEESGTPHAPSAAGLHDRRTRCDFARPRGRRCPPPSSPASSARSTSC